MSCLITASLLVRHLIIEISFCQLVESGWIVTIVWLPQELHSACTTKLLLISLYFMVWFFLTSYWLSTKKLIVLTSFSRSSGSKAFPLCAARIVSYATSRSQLVPPNGMNIIGGLEAHGLLSSSTIWNKWDWLSEIDTFRLFIVKLILLIFM